MTPSIPVRKGIEHKAEGQSTVRAIFSVLALLALAGANPVRGQQASVTESKSLHTGQRAAPAPLVRPRAGPNDDLFLAPDSNFMRSVYQRPASDPFKLVVVREVLLIAGDTEGAGALDRYLERVGLSILFGVQVSPTDTVEKTIQDELKADRSVVRELRAKALTASLRPGYALSAGSECTASPFGWSRECKYVEHSVWSDDPRHPSWTFLRIMVENTSGATISRFDADLRIRTTERERLELECKPISPTDVPPGQQQAVFCRASVQSAPADKLVGAVKGAQSDASLWYLEVRRIDFMVPPIYVDRNHAGWQSSAGAGTQARAEIRSVSCSDRGSCAEEVQHKFERDPRLYVGTWAFLIGAFLAGLIRPLGRRRIAAASTVSIVAVAVVAAYWVSILSRAENLGLGVFGLAYIWGIGLLAFLAGLWGTFVVLNLFRSKSPSASA